MDEKIVKPDNTAPDEDAKTIEETGAVEEAEEKENIPNTDEKIGEPEEMTVSPEGSEAAFGVEKRRRSRKRKRNRPEFINKLGRFFAPVGRVIKKLAGFFGEHPFIFMIILSLIVNLTIESCARHSFFAGIGHIFTSPLVYLYNCIVILMTYSVALIFKHKSFWYMLLTIIWVGLGIANGAILLSRVTPLTATDFKVLEDGIQLMDLYLSKIQIILIIIAVVLAIAAMVFVSIKSRKRKVNYPKSLAVIACSILVFIGSTSGLLKLGVLSTDFPNLADCYLEYGFVYSFYRSIFDHGVNKPSDYSEEAVEKIMTEIKSDTDNTPEREPNIVLIQLESFFDVNRLKNYSFSENPIPVFSYLKDNFSSGYVTVPSIGAGTSNTEFEILTGMSLDYFGTGEIPYKTILKETTCESLAYNLKSLGYSTHAIHNHSGDFYSRNIVFSNLGFDSFTSAEYIKNVTRNPIGWMNDSVLTGEIMKCLRSSDDRDFVYTISVQGHGKYPTEVVDETERFKIKSGPKTDEQKVQYEYYINQLSQTDKFISDLIIELTKFDEETVVILYGDHFPSLDIDDPDLADGNKFQTDYVMWTNFGLEKEDVDVDAYCLASYILGRFGINNGVMTKFHQNYAESESYDKALEMLEYDMLYGDRNIFSKKNPLEPTDIRYGIDEITFDDFSYDPELKQLYVTGKNFTERSMVYVGEDRKSTLYVDENTLVASGVTLSGGEEISVKQVTKSKKIMSTTPSKLYDAPVSPEDFDEDERLTLPEDMKPYDFWPDESRPDDSEKTAFEEKQKAERSEKTAYSTTTTLNPFTTTASEPPTTASTEAGETTAATLATEKEWVEGKV